MNTIQNVYPILENLLKYVGAYSNTFIMIYIFYVIIFKNTEIRKMNTNEFNIFKQIAFLLWLIIFNMLINVILKNIIRDPRPIDTSHYGIGYEYGMPSAHAQISTFLLLLLFTIDSPFIIRILAILFSVVTYLQRYIYNFHTIEQIIGGIITGILLWFSLVLNT